jgi:hypothetical protein
MNTEYVVYNSEDGCHVSDPQATREAAQKLAADWNHSGAPNLFRVKEWNGPGIWFGGAGF